MIGFPSLYKFQSPQQLIEETSRLSSGNEKFVYQGDFKKAREVWVIARFAVGYELMNGFSVEVKGDDNEPADATMKIGNDEIDYQIVESLSPGRKRGDEYKKRKNKPRPYQPLTAKESSDLIKETISSKIKKGYSFRNKTNLLIYANFDRYGLESDDMKKVSNDIKDNPFHEVWIYTSAFVDGRHCHAISRILPITSEFYAYQINDDKA
jgi:hypothetical protein